jgi:hypothetical protein
VAVLLGLGLGLWAPPLGAEPLRLAPEAGRAFQQLAAGAEKLARARAAAAALAAHERPQASPRDWEGMGESLQAAARSLQGAEGPALPELPSAIPLEQLRSCAARSSALTRAERAVRGLQVAAQRCAETRALLRDRQAEAQAADQDWRALEKALAALPEGSGVLELFPDRLAGQEAAVKAALTGYLSALGRQEDRLDKLQTDLRGRAAALASAAADVARARDCLIAGQWAGAATHAGTVSGVTLELVAAGAGYSGTANLGGVNLPVRGAVLNGGTLVVSVGSAGATLSGTLSSDGRTYSGTFSSAEGPASFNVHRQ